MFAVDILAVCMVALEVTIRLVELTLVANTLLNATMLLP